MEKIPKNRKNQLRTGKTWANLHTLPQVTLTTPTKPQAMKTAKRINSSDENRIATKIAFDWLDYCLNAISRGLNPGKLSVAMEQSSYIPGTMESMGYMTEVLTMAAKSRIKQYAIRTAVDYLKGDKKYESVAAHFKARANA